MIMSIRKTILLNLTSGFNNPYLISTGHQMAVKYNDKSVLESHHVAATFAKLQIPELNIFETFSR
jgi:hypothetical protein